ncbi:MAG: DUF721 domain-containing protein [Bacillota bacterium]
MGLEKRIKEEQAALIWPRVAGIHIARKTRGMWVKDGVLYVYLSTSAWAHQLSYLKAQLLERIEKELGKGVIRDIRFGSGPPRGPCVTEMVDEVRQEQRCRTELTQQEIQLAEEAASLVNDNELSKLVYRLVMSARKWRCEVGKGLRQVR